MIIISFLILIIFILLVVYSYKKYMSYSLIKKLREKNKYYPYILLLVIIILFLLYMRVRCVSAFIIFLHYSIITLFAQLIFKFLRKYKISKYENVIALSTTIIFLAVGAFFSYYIFETKYTIYSDKINEDIKIVQITDSHIGITLDGKRFNKYITKIRKLNPDILVITGDFVDDDTTKKDMLEATAALANINPKYGKYFIYGNHDRGYYSNHKFTEQELVDNLESSSVVVLKDESVLINNDFYIIGREDRSVNYTSKRKEAYELTENLDKSKYMIMLDHQPNDYANEIKSNVDLVLSGHTHGGHAFPANIIGKLIGANDMINGIDKRGNTTFIVSSGISGWAIPFKTCAISEYVVIDIKKK